MFIIPPTFEALGAPLEDSVELDETIDAEGKEEGVDAVGSAGFVVVEVYTRVVVEPPVFSVAMGMGVEAEALNKLNKSASVKEIVALVDWLRGVPDASVIFPDASDALFVTNDS